MPSFTSSPPGPLAGLQPAPTYAPYQRVLRGPAGRAPVSTRVYTPLAVVVFVAFLAGQLIAGTDPQVAFFFSLASMFGLLAVGAAGGVRTGIGALNLVIVGKFLLFMIVVKIVVGEATEKNFYAADRTGQVMVVGFAALWLASLAFGALPRVVRIMPSEFPGKLSLLLMSWVFFLVGNGASFFVLAVSAETHNGMNTSGGLLSVARQFALFGPMCVPIVMVYLWRKGTRTWLLHPLFIFMIVVSMIPGLVSAKKRDALQPIALAIGIIVARDGFRSKRFVGLAVGIVAGYGLFLYPYSQYARAHGGRDMNFEDRAFAIEQIVTNFISDPGYRDIVEAHIQGAETLCFDSPALLPVNRFAVACFADRLIAASDSYRIETGWTTITWGFKILVPRFLYPEKPLFGAGNYFGHLTGEVQPWDHYTQIAYGIMADFYCSFRLAGVFVGTFVFFLFAYWILTLLFGRAELVSSPSASTLYWLMIVGLFHEVFVEGVFSTMLPALIIGPLLLWFLFSMTQVTYTLVQQAGKTTPDSQTSAQGLAALRAIGKS